MAEKKIESTFEAPRDIYEIVFNSANDGILLADVEDKRFLMANNKICKMLGYTREEILKLSIADLHPKESLPQVMEEFGKQVRGETEIASNLPVRRQDGSIFFADINSVPITISGKRLMLGMFRDVTERKKAEEALKEKVKELEIFHEAAVERELNMEELRKKVKELEEKLGGKNG